MPGASSAIASVRRKAQRRTQLRPRSPQAVPQSTGRDLHAIAGLPCCSTGWTPAWKERGRAVRQPTNRRRLLLSCFWTAAARSALGLLLFAPGAFWSCKSSNTVALRAGASTQATLYVIICRSFVRSVTGLSTCCVRCVAGIVLACNYATRS